MDIMQTRNMTMFVPSNKELLSCTDENLTFKNRIFSLQSFVKFLLHMVTLYHSHLLVVGITFP